MINKLRIVGFRSFKDLTVEGLGRVNLITGRNNVGKSTFLEAVRLLTTEGAEATLLEILRYREEVQVPVAGSESASKLDELIACTHLFHGFPSLGKNGESFSIMGENGDSPSMLTARIVAPPDKPDGKQQHLITPSSEERWQTTEDYPFLALEITTSTRHRQAELYRPFHTLWRRAEAFNPQATPSVFLDPFSSRVTGQFADLWDRVALTDNADHVVRALQLISKDISAITMVGSSSGTSRTAIVRSSAFDHPVPLKSFGDGVNRVFGLILSLTCAKGGYLLIDEIENGLHHSIQADAFRAIFKLARDLNVQVFATTHSRDCIEAFQKAAEESPDEGVLVRLTRKDDKIFSTVFPEKQLQVVTENQIEVR